MRFPTLLTALLLLWSMSAFAQGSDFKGLDVTGDEPKKEEPQKEEPPPQSLPPPEPPGAQADSAAAPKGDQKLDEVQIANEDRVKSVERKAFLKKYRFELTPMGFVTVNDSFYAKSGPAVRLGFFFSDSLGLAFRYDQYNAINNDDTRIAKRELQSRLPYVQPQHGFSLELLWSPVYGKVAVGNSINTFDVYVVGGAGVVLSKTTYADSTSNWAGDGPHVSAHVGIGQKFHLLDWLAVDLSLIDTLYMDRPDNAGGGADQGAKSILQNLVSLNLGLSFYLPLGFEYKEP